MFSRLKEQTRGNWGIWGVPRPCMLRPDDLLDQFTKLRKAVILMTTVDYSKRIKDKINEEKRHIGWMLAETRQNFPSVPS